LPVPRDSEDAGGFGRVCMTCEKARSEFPFLLYGELSFDQEEAVERHLDGCPECRAALASEKHFHAALNLSDTALPSGLLSSSRGQLLAHLASERDSGVRSLGWPASRWSALGSWFSWARSSFGAWMRPAGSSAPSSSATTTSGSSNDWIIGHRPSLGRSYSRRPN